MFGISTLQIKLLLLALGVALVGYSYYWTYNQGRHNGASDMVVVQAKAMLKLQKENALEAMELRKKELLEARQIADERQKNDQKLIVDLKKANDILKKEPAAATVVPPAVISLLNSAGGSPSPKD